MVSDRLLPHLNLWWSRLLSRRFQLTCDFTVMASAFALAYLLRFDFHVPAREVRPALYQLPVVLLAQFGALYLCGVYSFIWRYIGISEVKAFLYAALLSAAPVISLRVGLPETLQPWRVPLSVIFIDTVLAFVGLLGIRVLRRILYEKLERKGKGKVSADCRKRPVLLVGAGRAGVMTAREIAQRGDLDLEVKGFVDDNPSKRGAIIQGVKVVGGTADLPRLVAEYGIDHVVISIAHTSRKEFKRILDICESVPVKVRVIPGIFEILNGRVNVSRIRDVQIEDLLGREPVRLDEKNLADFLTGKVVMVTGAGGSIGSELARQVVRFKPEKLILVERAEPALFEIDKELDVAHPGVQVIPVIGDVGDEKRMKTVFAIHTPQVVLHAAAHKHVPMMEFNPGEAVKNNVLATRLIGELAGRCGVETFVLISTDKAVRPTSVMGASKRVAELVTQWLDKHYQTRFVAVRFGNVIGSAGSVIPIFREQIRKGGPVTVTHPEMKRYFMTIPEASQLVLQAGAMGEGGEIFVLDMGEPISIRELAEETITLCGLKPYEEIAIEFTGVRPGEKLFEELETTGERVLKTRHPKIFIGKIAGYPEERMRRALDELRELSSNGHERELRVFLNELLPEADLKYSQDPNPAPASPPHPQAVGGVSAEGQAVRLSPSAA